MGLFVFFCARRVAVLFFLPSPACTCQCLALRVSVPWGFFQNSSLWYWREASFLLWYKSVRVCFPSRNWAISVIAFILAVGGYVWMVWCMFATIHRNLFLQVLYSRCTDILLHTMCDGSWSGSAHSISVITYYNLVRRVKSDFPVFC